MTLIIHGVPLSQPFRSVVWPCLLKGLPFSIQLAIPGTKDTFKYSTRRPDFVSKFPFRTIPSIEDDHLGREIYLSEAPAILAYLSSVHGWDDFYPIAPLERAKVDEYLHWHHSNLRYLSKGYFRPFMMPHPLMKSDMMKIYQKTAENALKVLENDYLAYTSSNGYLLGTPHPTLADFMAYEEVCQLWSEFCNLYQFEEAHPNIIAWLERMKSIPFHDEVHVSLKLLGDLSSKDGHHSITKRLANANKEGLKAISNVIEGQNLKSRL